VYGAYQYLTRTIAKATYVGPASYGADIEAYAFRKGGTTIHVLWTRTDITTVISIPAASFISATTRDGASITPTANGANYEITAGFEPVYLFLR
jgi:hypothetical protein